MAVDSFNVPFVHWYKPISCERKFMNNINETEKDVFKNMGWSNGSNGWRQTGNIWNMLYSEGEKKIKRNVKDYHPLQNERVKWKEKTSLGKSS